MKCFVQTKRDKVEFTELIILILVFAALLSYQFTGNDFNTKPTFTLIINLLTASALMIAITWLETCYILRN